MHIVLEFKADHACFQRGVASAKVDSEIRNKEERKKKEWGTHSNNRVSASPAQT